MKISAVNSQTSHNGTGGFLYLKCVFRSSEPWWCSCNIKNITLPGHGLRNAKGSWRGASPFLYCLPDWRKGKQKYSARKYRNQINNSGTYNPSLNNLWSVHSCMESRIYSLSLAKVLQRASIMQHHMWFRWLLYAELCNSPVIFMYVDSLHKCLKTIIAATDLSVYFTWSRSECCLVKTKHHQWGQICSCARAPKVFERTPPWYWKLNWKSPSIYSNSSKQACIIMIESQNGLG